MKEKIESIIATQKLESVLEARVLFSDRDWTSYTLEVLKTKIRVTFISDPYSKGFREGVTDSKAIEHGLTANFTIENVIKHHQKELFNDLVKFTQKGAIMDELKEVLTW